MKKLVRFLPLALAIVMMALAFSSCGFISDKLKDAGIEINISMSSDYNAAKKALIKAGYDNTELKEVKETDENDTNVPEGLVATLTASKTTSSGKTEAIELAYFKDAKSAQAFWDKYEENIKSSLEEDYENLASEPKCDISGKVIYAATENALEVVK